MTNRRTSREQALQVLYSISVTGYSVSKALESFRQIEADFSPEVDAFAKKLLGTTVENMSEVDATLKSVLEHWSLDRLSLVDKNILRLATCELRFFEDVPPKVTINEYIEIAKEYSDTESPSFINGVLDQIARRISALVPQHHLLPQRKGKD